MTEGIISLIVIISLAGIVAGIYYIYQTSIRLKDIKNRDAKCVEAVE